METSCPHTPQQNDVVERKHQHLLEIARALRFEAGLPVKFWGECINTTTYILKRLPSKAIKNKTPYEVLFEKEPCYDHMRVFGCLVYAKTTNTKGDKFEVRGRKGVFVGCPQGQKGYFIYDISDNNLSVSRDVRFVEHSFPFKTVKTDHKITEEDDFEPYEEDEQESVVTHFNEDNKRYQSKLKGFL